MGSTARRKVGALMLTYGTGSAKVALNSASKVPVTSRDCRGLVVNSTAAHDEAKHFAATAVCSRSQSEAAVLPHSWTMAFNGVTAEGGHEEVEQTRGANIYASQSLDAVNAQNVFGSGQLARFEPK